MILAMVKTQQHACQKVGITDAQWLLVLAMVML
jgi:hypothetical protein